MAKTIRLFRFGSELARDHELVQEVVYYGDSRFRSLLVAYNQADRLKRTWMMRYLHMELVCERRSNGNWD
jgi:hypothetical protein